jgi:hypothetical protein
MLHKPKNDKIKWLKNVYSVRKCYKYHLVLIKELKCFWWNTPVMRIHQNQNWLFFWNLRNNAGEILYKVIFICPTIFRHCYVATCRCNFFKFIAESLSLNLSSWSVMYCTLFSCVPVQSAVKCMQWLLVLLLVSHELYLKNMNSACIYFWVKGLGYRLVYW